jgi:DNA-directed RNA polymerase subunit M/transcription elongation factor TFIIS
MRERGRAFLAKKLVDVDCDRLADRLESACWNACLRKCAEKGMGRALLWDEEPAPSKGLLTWTPAVRRCYCFLLQTTRFNLDAPHILNQLLDGSLQPKEYVAMDRMDVWPSRWSDALNEARMKALIKEQCGEDIAKIPDSDITCRRCGGRKVSYTQLQTRSADEPMTVFAYCHGCSRRFRF